MTEPATKPERKPDVVNPQLTVADCLHIAVDAIDIAAMKGGYASYTPEQQAAVRAAQNVLSRMATNAQRVGQAKQEAASTDADKPAKAKPASARKGTKPKGKRKKA